MQQNEKEKQLSVEKLAGGTRLHVDGADSMAKAHTAQAETTMTT